MCICPTEDAESVAASRPRPQEPDLHALAERIVSYCTGCILGLNAPTGSIVSGVESRLKDELFEDVSASPPPQEAAEALVRGHDRMCMGFWHESFPWCAAAPVGTPLCEPCQQLADKIAGLLVGRTE